MFSKKLLLFSLCLVISAGAFGQTNNYNILDTAPATGGPPTGPAGGDLSGTYPNPVVSNLSGVPFGTAATANTGTSGHTLGFLDGTNTYSGLSTFTASLNVNSATTTVPDVLIKGIASQTAAYWRILDSSSNYIHNSVPNSSTDPRARDCWYNTLETTPTNYERGCIYFDNLNNLYRIETQNGGTGTLRAMALQAGGGRTLVGSATDDGSTTLQIAGVTSIAGTGSNVAIAYSGTAQKGFLDINSNGSLFLSANVNGANVISNTALPQWRFAFAPSTSDSFQLQRSPAGATYTPATLLYLDNIGQLGLSGGSPGALLDLNRSISKTPTGSGVLLRVVASTVTDNATAASGTAASFAGNGFGQPTFTATNTGVTTTNAYTLTILGAPKAGTNETFTSATALAVLSGASNGTNTYGLTVAAQTGGSNNYAAAFTGGNVGLGTTSPTAKIHITAGTATASTSPLKFTSGTNLTTPEAGSMEFNGTNLEFTPGSTRYNVQTSLSGTTGTITGTALSTTCDSGTVTVTGAVIGNPVAVSSTTGADVGGTFYLRGSVTSTNTVTVYICGTGTPASLAYNVRVLQ